MFGTVWHFFRHRLIGMKHRKLLVAMIMSGLLVVAVGATYWYAVYQQRLAYSTYAS